MIGLCRAMPPLVLMTTVFVTVSVTGLVTASEFTTTFEGQETNWVLELREYGDFIVAVTDAVARAHKEGGVLGFGGKEVSEREQAVMDRVAMALGPRPGTA